MYCEAMSCLYNKDFSCTQKEPHFDARGICQDFNEVPVPGNVWDWMKETYLETLKE